MSLDVNFVVMRPGHCPGKMLCNDWTKEETKAFISKQLKKKNSKHRHSDSDIHCLYCGIVLESVLCVQLSHVTLSSRPPTNNMACSSTWHRDTFQDTKWGCELIVLDVRVCVFCLQVPQELGGGLVCASVCVSTKLAAWDKLRQVTTGGRREECGGGLRLQEFCACFAAYSHNQTHLHWHRAGGIKFYALGNFPDLLQVMLAAGNAQE